MATFTEISQGVKISVLPAYHERFSKPELNYYIFSYTVEITNMNDFPVQLLSRKWLIFDSLNDQRIVQGEGVIGKQPMLLPTESYTYTSSCDLVSEVGQMKGSYFFKNIDTDEIIEVKIPEFKLEVNYKLN